MRQFTTYQAAVNSFPLSEARIGVMVAGRYSGFDLMTTGAGGGDIPINIGHSSLTPKNITSNNLVGDLEGSILTPQGVVVKASETFNLPISNNTSFSMRYDIIYFQYTWADDILGGDALVGVIEGTADGVVPSLTSVTQVILGIISVPEDATFSELVYTPSQVPLLGGVNIITNFPELDDRFARLNYPNRFTKLQSDNVSVIPLVMDGNGHIIVGESGNSLKLTGDSITNYIVKGFIPEAGREFPDGTHLRIMFNSPGVSSVFSSDPSSTGQSINFDYFYPEVEPGQELAFSTGQVWEFVLLPSKKWYIVNAPSIMYRDYLSVFTTLSALQSSLTGGSWVRVKENGVSGTAFTPDFTSVGYSNFEALRYRLGLANSLDITGNFDVASDIGFDIIEVFELPLAYRPSRSLAFAIYLVAPGGSGSATHYNGYIETNGKLYVNFNGVSILAGNRLSIELSIPR